MRGAALVAAALCALLVAGCSRQATQRITAVSRPLIGTAAAASLIGGVQGGPLRKRPGRIYAGQYFIHNAVYYSLEGHNQNPLGYTPYLYPRPGIAVDSKGYVDVVDPIVRQVLIFKNVQQSPILRLDDPRMNPFSVTVSHSGTVYVGNITTGYVGAPGNVAVFKAGGPVRTLLADSNFNQVANLALDSKEDLYVSYDDVAFGRHIAEFLHGNTTPRELGTFPGEVFTIDVRDNIVMAAKNELLIYQPQSSIQVASIPIHGYPSALAFNSKGDVLYYIDSTTNTVDACTYLAANSST